MPRQYDSSALEQNKQRLLKDMSDISILDAQRFHEHFRKLAVSHLRNGDGSVARGFRLEYAEVFKNNLRFDDFSKSIERYLRHQSNTRVWGTYIEATALGESLGVNVVVYPKNNGKVGAPIVLYKAGDTLDSKQTVNLVCSNNQHWEAFGLRNDGGGDCLYRAFSQEVCRLNQQLPVSHSSEGSDIVEQKNSATPTPAQLEKAMPQAPSPQERVVSEKKFNDYLNRLVDNSRSATNEDGRNTAKLNQVLSQIVEDRCIALELARGENSASTSYKLPDLATLNELKPHQQLTELMHFLDGKNRDAIMQNLGGAETIAQRFNGLLTNMPVNEEKAFMSRSAGWVKNNGELYNELIQHQTAPQPSASAATAGLFSIKCDPKLTSPFTQETTLINAGG